MLPQTSARSLRSVWQNELTRARAWEKAAIKAAAAAAAASIVLREQIFQNAAADWTMLDLRVSPVTAGAKDRFSGGLSISNRCVCAHRCTCGWRLRADWAVHSCFTKKHRESADEPFHTLFFASGFSPLLAGKRGGGKGLGFKEGLRISMCVGFSGIFCAMV